MKITLSNPNQNADITGAQLTDIYPVGMVNAPNGAVISNGCGGSVIAAANGSSTSLTNGTIPAGGACEIVIGVVGTSVGSPINSTGTVTSSNAPTGASASATLKVTSGVPLAAPTVSRGSGHRA